MFIMLSGDVRKNLLFTKAIFYNVSLNLCVAGFNMKIDALIYELVTQSVINSENLRRRDICIQIPRIKHTQMCVSCCKHDGIATILVWFKYTLKSN